MNREHNVLFHQLRKDGIVKVGKGTKRYYCNLCHQSFDSKLHFITRIHEREIARAKQEIERKRISI